SLFDDNAWKMPAKAIETLLQLTDLLLDIARAPEGCFAFRLGPCLQVGHKLEVRQDGEHDRHRQDQSNNDRLSVPPSTQTRRDTKCQAQLEAVHEQHHLSDTEGNRVEQFVGVRSIDSGTETDLGNRTIALESCEASQCNDPYGPVDGSRRFRHVSCSV